MIIDAHHHFWLLSRGDYEWLTPETGKLYRDFQPEDLNDDLSKSGISGTVLIQAAPTEAETHDLLEIADRWPKALGVVGWTDLTSQASHRRLEGLARHPMLKGIRPMLQDERDPDWILQSQVSESLKIIQTLGLAFDALVRPRHLKSLALATDRHPGLRIVIDHAGKPEIEKGEFDDWAMDIKALSERPNIFCKLSGLLTEAGSRTADNDLRPYIDHLLNCFGPRRLMWGSDWPVLLGKSGYSQWFDQAVRLTAELGTREKQWLFGRTAAAFYNIKIDHDR